MTQAGLGYLRGRNGWPRCGEDHRDREVAPPVQIRNGDLRYRGFASIRAGVRPLSAEWDRVTISELCAENLRPGVIKTGGRGPTTNTAGRKAVDPGGWFRNSADFCLFRRILRSKWGGGRKGELRL